MLAAASASRPWRWQGTPRRLGPKRTPPGASVLNCASEHGSYREALLERLQWELDALPELLRILASFGHPF